MTLGCADLSSSGSVRRQGGHLLTASEACERATRTSSAAHSPDWIAPSMYPVQCRGLNVVVGRYRPPLGGPNIRATLQKLLRHPHDPYLIHQAYEALHPFTDGNGRSGRALWLHMMGGPDAVPLGFLHTWYYQSLRFHSGNQQDRITEDFWRSCASLAGIRALSFTCALHTQSSLVL